MANDNFYKRLAEKNKPEDPAIANLENNSYDDIDWLNKANAPIYKEIKEWKEKQKKSNWLGKWYMQIRINELEKKLYHYKQ
jgi:hypothetical protein